MTSGKRGEKRAVHSDLRDDAAAAVHGLNLRYRYSPVVVSLETLDRGTHLFADSTVANWTGGRGLQCTSRAFSAYKETVAQLCPPGICSATPEEQSDVFLSLAVAESTAPLHFSIDVQFKTVVSLANLSRGRMCFNGWQRRNPASSWVQADSG